MNRIALTLLLIACVVSVRARDNNPAPPPPLFSWGESGVDDAPFNPHHGIGYDPTCVLEATGDTYCWGYEAFAQFGSAPVASRQLSISAEREHSCSIATDTKLMCRDDVTLPFPPAPMDLAASIYSRNAVELFWNSDFANTSIVGFEVYRDDEFLAFTTRHSYVDEQVDLGHARRYAVFSVTRSRVRSIDAPVVDVDLENP